MLKSQVNDWILIYFEFDMVCPIMEGFKRTLLIIIDSALSWLVEDTVHVQMTKCLSGKGYLKAPNLEWMWGVIRKISQTIMIELHRWLKSHKNAEDISIIVRQVSHIQTITLRAFHVGSVGHGFGPQNIQLQNHIKDPLPQIVIIGSERWRPRSQAQSGYDRSGSSPLF
jgi:hypothetical protein